MVGEVLYFDNGVVKMSQEGLSLPGFRSLYDHDKNKGKPLFKRYVEAIWYVYSKDSPYYYGMSLQERIDIYEEETCSPHPALSDRSEGGNTKL